MKEYRLTRDLAGDGLSRADLRRLTTDGNLERLRRGVYAPPSQRDAEAQHRLLIASTLELGQGESVVGFGSAAVLHGLPTWASSIRRVHLIRNRRDSGRIRSGVHVHVASLAATDIQQIAQVDDVGLTDTLLTSLPRTFVDLARTAALPQAVAAGDHGLRLGMDLDQVGEQLESARRRQGIATARHAARLLDDASESPGESISRVLFAQHGLAQPELQVEILGGDEVVRVDFFWPEFNLIGEFDGRIKYGRLLRPGETPGDAVFREKQREDRLRDLGYRVVRWTWDDLGRPRVLIARIAHAFARPRG